MSVKNLKKLLSMSSNQLAEKLTKTTNCTDGENYFYYAGQGNILFTAHIDTVNLPDYKAKPVQLKDCLINSDTMPIGGDDRVGVYYGFKYHYKNNVPLLLTNYEETGGMGMHKFVKDIIIPDPTILSDIDLIVAIDRAGVGHYVTYDDTPLWLDEYMEDTGLIERQGTWCDCQILSDAIDVHSINIACGYYRNHTRMESIDLSDLKKTATYLDNILAMAGDIPEYKEKYGERINRKIIDSWYQTYNQGINQRKKARRKKKDVTDHEYLNGYNPDDFHY